MLIRLSYHACSTFRFPDRESGGHRLQPLSSMFRFKRESREVAPRARGPRIQAGKLCSANVEHELIIDLGLAQDEVSVSEAVAMKVLCTVLMQRALQDRESIEPMKTKIKYILNITSISHCSALLCSALLLLCYCSATALLLQVRYPWEALEGRINKPYGPCYRCVIPRTGCSLGAENSVGRNATKTTQAILIGSERSMYGVVLRTRYLERGTATDQPKPKSRDRSNSVYHDD